MNICLQKKRSKEGIVSFFNTAVPSWKNKYDIASIQRAIIEVWLIKNKLKKSKINKRLATYQLLDSGNSKFTMKIYDELIKSEINITLYDIEAIFEDVIDNERKERYGIVYTPLYIRDYLLSHCLKKNYVKYKENYKFCDPACGSGGFLLQMAEKIKNISSLSYEQIFTKNIYGIDKDLESIRYAKILCELFLLSKDTDPSNIEFNLLNDDTLLSKPKEIFKQVNGIDGFSSIATNPPYVRIQNLDNNYRARLKKEYSIFSQGNYGLSLLFFHAVYRLLGTNGCAGIITQNNLFTSASGAETRKWAQENKIIDRIIDFGPHYAFPNVSAYTCLLMFSRTSKKTFEFSRLNKDVTEYNVNNLAISTLRFDDLKWKKWQLVEEPHFTNLQKMEKLGTPLGSLVRIRVGLATLLDNAFIIKGNNTKNGIQYNVGNQCDIEIGSTKPVIKVSDITDNIKTTTTRIIFPYIKDNGRFVIIREKEFIKKFPNAYNHLLFYKNLLLTRDKGRGDDRVWYRWGRRQGMEAPGPKLLTKTFSKKPNFIFCSDDKLFCNGYALFKNEVEHKAKFCPSLEFIGRVLNSDLFYYYMKLTSFQISGGYQCYQKKFIEDFNIPNLKKEEISELMNLEDFRFLDELCEIYRIKSEDIYSGILAGN